MGQCRVTCALEEPSEGGAHERHEAVDCAALLRSRWVASDQFFVRNAYCFIRHQSVKHEMESRIQAEASQICLWLQDKTSDRWRRFLKDSVPMKYFRERF